MMKDELFKKDIYKQFEFDESVVSVFDDMITRSVPLYEENLRLILAFIASFTAQKARICDLGCSTASLLIELFKQDRSYILSGVDSSSAMLHSAQNKSKAFKANISFKCCDLLEYDFEKNDVFIANYTLQFIRPPQRQNLVDKIYQNLSPGGFFIMSEKILYEDAKFAKNIIEIYADFKKKQGYSEFEIVKKREALENILIPYTEQENISMLQKAGFAKVQSFFKWANFESFIAFKE